MDRWRPIWKRLTQEEQREGALEYVLSMEGHPDARQALVQFLGDAYRSRAKTVAGWTPSKRAERLARLADLPTPFLREFVTAFLVKRRPALLAAFLDAAEIPNTNGVIDPPLTAAPAEKVRLMAGALAIREAFCGRDVEIYLDACAAQGVGIWKHLPEARAEAQIKASAVEAVPEEAPGTLEETTIRSVLGTRLRRAEGAAVRVALPDPVLSDPERLSCLDEAVRDAIVSYLEDDTGKRPASRARLLVAELAGLDEERHRSAYHAGFLDAMAGVEPSPRPRTGTRGQGWFVAGAVAGYSRCKSPAGVMALLDRFPADAKRLLGDRHEACSEAVGAMVQAYYAAGRQAEALSALTASAVARGGEPLMHRLLAEADGATSADAPTASRIVALVSDAMLLCAQRGRPIGDRLRSEVARRLASIRPSDGATSDRTKPPEASGDGGPGPSPSAPSDSANP